MRSNSAHTPPSSQPSQPTINVRPSPSPTLPLSPKPWQLTADRISRETDSARLAALIDQLCRELDEAGREPGGVYGER